MSPSPPATPATSPCGACIGGGVGVGVGGEAALGCAAVAAFCIVWRTLSLGALDNDHFIHLARAHQVLHGYWPLRDFSDPGLPGHYLASAAVAWTFGATPLADAALHIAMLAIAAAVTFSRAQRASGSRAIGTLIALAQVLSMPRLYGAPKVLIYVVAIAAAWRFIDAPSRGRAACLGAWTAVAFLMRHDHGLYVAVLSTVVIVMCGWRRDRGWRGDAATALGLAALALLPWVAYVSTYGGVSDYLTSALEFSRAEAVRTARQWPGVSSATASPVAFAQTAALYLALLVPFVTLIAPRGRHPRLTRAHLIAVGLLLAMCEVGFLRDRMVDRLPDIGGPLAIAVASLVGRRHVRPSPRPRRRHPLRSPLGRGATVGLVAATGVVVLGLSLAAPRLLGRSLSLSERLASVVAGGTRWPWQRTMPTPDLLPLVGYVDACTRPADAVLAGWFAPEFSVFARRPFAGGHPSWLPGYYAAQAEQDWIVGWLTSQPPRVVLLDGTFEQGWPSAFAALAASGRYTPVGTTRVGTRVVRVWIRDVPAAPGRDPHLGLPCVDPQSRR